MLNDIVYPSDGTYRPGEYHSPERFFSQCLANSSEFDLQLGYFNSAAISVLAEGFATFISKGGNMRLVINQIVSAADKKAISKGMGDETVEWFDLSNFEQLRQTFDEYEQQFFECLAYLIKEQRIDIRIIKPKNRTGIAHTKTGQFRDGESVTSFTGSANFTLGGLFNNLEEIKIDRSESTDRMVQNRISSQRAKFEAIMQRKQKNIVYLPADELISVLQTAYGDKDIEELLDVEQKLREYRRKRQKTNTQTLSEEEVEYNQTPRFPYPTGPREYQQTAFDNWKNNGQKGLFAMATGTGKTITSLNCLLEIYKRCGYYKAIILVPTITLVGQWEVECRKFRFANIIRVCSKNPKWREQIHQLAYEEKYVDPTSCYIIISTYASFSKEMVFRLLNSFDRKRLLLIADEAHNVGSPLLLKKLGEVAYLRRIGLSATPERQFDEQTNRKVFGFFGATEKFTYEYSMSQAIERGVLCRYYYYPHLVRLNEEEMARYVELSVKIAKYFNFNTGTFDKKDDILTSLLLARKRIVHKAANKMETFRQILQERISNQGHLKYTLVYVPEGNTPDYYSDPDLYVENDDWQPDNETEHLIDLYTKAVTEVDAHVTVRQFISGMAGRDSLLADFAEGRLHVLTSMKCLDEGVDVPRSELAIFCASTGNPRQFIQRRGRILRVHPDKSRAIIHDMVVVPEVNPHLDCYRMERALLKSELCRVKDFSMLSENSSYTEEVLFEVMNYYNLNLYQNE